MMLSRTAVALKSTNLRIRPIVSTKLLSSMASTGVPKRVLVPIATGTEEIEAVTVIDTLVRGGASVTVASVMPGALQVVCSRGVKLGADKFIEDCVSEDYDLVVCPGGMPGAVNLSESSSLKEILIKQFSANKYIAAVCAAPAVVLAKHGILDGKAATCYPADKFKSAIGKYSTDSVVVDGNLITSQGNGWKNIERLSECNLFLVNLGPGTSLLFSLKLVEILFGEEKSVALAKEMLLQ